LGTYHNQATTRSHGTDPAQTPPLMEVFDSPSSQVIKLGLQAKEGIELQTSWAGV